MDAVSRSSTTVTSCGALVESPSSRPAVALDTTTWSAPLCRTSGMFSVSRTAATIHASGASARAVSTVSTAASSASVATITARARPTSASRSTAERELVPSTTISPRAVASFTAAGSRSTTTTWSSGTPSSSSVSTALRPFVPYPQTTTCWCTRDLHRRIRNCSRDRSVSTSSVVPTRMMRKSTRAGATNSTFTSRAAALAGATSP